MTERAKGKVLIDIARGAIAEKFGASPRPLLREDWLGQPGATFVTLTLKGNLRGCIGSLQAHRALTDDLRQNAVSAAFHDPRFVPLTREEFALIEVEVSLLSALQPIAFSDEADALAQLRPGVDGIVFEFENCRSTFLPQVWEQLPEPRQFLAHLKRKAGLPDDFWADNVKLSRYVVTKWRESELEDKG